MRRKDLFTQISMPSLAPESIAKIGESMLAGNVDQGLIEKLAGLG